MSDDGAQCSICGVPELTHAEAEAHRTVNHRWTLTGELLPLQQSPNRPQQAQMIIANAVDMQLRRILIDKGVLTHADFAPSEAPGTGSAGDLGTGAAESTG